MGALTDAVRRLLDSLQVSSASPGHINVVLQTDPGIDLDEALEEAQKDNNVKQQKETNDTVKKVKRFEAGNVGDIQNFSSQQFGNVKQLATNPFGFITGVVFKKFAKGVGIFALVILIEEAVKFIIREALKPGRFMDRRFKRDIEKELIAFRRREDQSKIKQGFSNIIITTGPRLRGGQGQTYNTLDGARNNNLPVGLAQKDILVEASGGSMSKKQRQEEFR